MQWLNSGEQMKLIDAEQVRELFVSWQNGAGDDWDSFLRRLAALPDATPPAQWQPIETAPKDGTEILVFGESGVATDSWSPGCYVSETEDAEAGWSMLGHTHWMPLPPAPGDAP
jgi:hypothetical protein